jgi:hypothetical protein
MEQYSSITEYTKKDFTGATCFILPLGNNYPRKQAENFDPITLIREVEIVSIGKNIIKKNNHRLFGKVTISGDLDNNNYGWLAFPSLQAAKLHIFKARYISIINQFNLNYLTNKDVNKIVEIISKYKG